MSPRRDPARPGPSALLDPRTLAQIKGLTLRARRVVDGVLQGIHKSPHHGSSIEFAEHHEYSPGDEIRHIDWKAYARLDTYYVKRFEQETNLKAWFVLDSSASMAYGADELLTKYEYATIIAASLGFLLLRQQDAIGVVTFAARVGAMVPARAQMRHLNHLARVLESIHPSGTTDLASGIARVSERATKRGLVFVLSDFFGEQEAAFRLLRQLVGRGHHVVVMHVLDGDELSFPFGEMTLFEGMETKRRLLVEPRLVRAAYLRRLEAHRAQVRAACLGNQIEDLLIDTREPPERLLRTYLNQRGARRRLAKGGHTTPRSRARR